MNPVYVKGSPFSMGSGETLPITLDAAPLLDPGEAPSSVTSSLVDLTDGSSYLAGLSGTPTVSGTKLIQTVTGLQPATAYRLVIQFTAAVGKVWQMALEIDCDL